MHSTVTTNQERFNVVKFIENKRPLNKTTKGTKYTNKDEAISFFAFVFIRALRVLGGSVFLYFNCGFPPKIYSNSLLLSVRITRDSGTLLAPPPPEGEHA
jgi:hypothetical protein